jgi:hypothetical protein
MEPNMSEKPIVRKKIVVTPKKRKPELIEDYPLSMLQEHPKQYVYFQRPTEAEVEKLADDMERNGQVEPAEILPDGTLIAGHKRKAARLFSRKETIRVLIRHDLAGDEQATERRMLESNVNRRHLSRLELAKLQLRMWELSPEADTRKGRGKINHEIAATLDISERQVCRYLGLLRGPMELLYAVEDGRLKVSHAFKVVKLLKRSPELAAPILTVLRDDPGNREVKAMVEQASAGDKAPRPSKPAALLKKLLKVGDELAENKAVLKAPLTDDERKSVATLRRLLEKIEGRSSPAA